MVDSAKVNSITVVDEASAEVPKWTLKDVEMLDKRKVEKIRAAEDKRTRLAERLAIKHERVANFAIQRAKQNVEKMAINRARQEIVQDRIEKAKSAKYYWRLNLIKTLDDRNARLKQCKENMKTARRIEKSEKNVIYYNKLVNSQNHTKVVNARLLSECLSASKNDKWSDGQNDTEEESHPSMERSVGEEAIGQCPYSKHTKPIPEPSNEMATASMLMERVNALKANFRSCKEGAQFLEKTQLLWEKLTMCIKSSEKIETRSESSTNMYYRNLKGIYDKSNSNAEDRQKLQNKTSIIQQVMFNGINLKLEDDEVLDLIKKAKSLAGPRSNAADIIQLAKRIIEQEADTKHTVQYITSSLIERSVFEFTKRRLAHKIAIGAQKTVDRLQHLNSIDLIPEELLTTKKKEEVSLIVLELLRDDHKYGYLDTRTSNEDDTLVTQALAIEKMHLFLTENKQLSKSRSCAKKKEAAKSHDQVATFKMIERDILISDIDRVVEAFMECASTMVARSVSEPSKSSQYIELDKTMAANKFYRISRKLAKIIFCMISSYNEKIYTADVVIDKFLIEINKVSPKVKYGDRTKKPVMKVIKTLDLSYFPKMVNYLISRK